MRSYLRLRGWLVIRQQQGLGSHKGIADLYCLKGGRSVWVEIKTATGRQSDAQKQFEADVLTFGGEYWLVRSVDEAMHL